MSDFSNLSLADLRSIEKEIREQKKAVKSVEDKRMSALLTEFVETVVTEQDPESSDKSAWVGYKAYAIPMEIEGTHYSVSVTITDVAAKTAREPQFAKADA